MVINLIVGGRCVNTVVLDLISDCGIVVQSAIVTVLVSMSAIIQVS